MSRWMPRGRVEWSAAIVGVVALVLFAWLAAKSPQQGMLSYLFAFVFFTGLAIGAVALVMVHVLTGGEWGDALRPQLMAAARTLPLQLLFAVPILTQIGLLYSWDHADALATDPLLRAQGWYLNAPFFIARTLSYFIVWLALVLLLVRGYRRVAAGGLIIYALSTLLASTDWVMSLIPHWHSSIFGMMVATGCMMAAASLAILHLMTSSPGAAAAAPRLRGDLGNLLLTFVLAWWYLAFMQYLTIWVADLPAETVWYIPRTLTSWRWLAWAGIIGNFVLPFLLLLVRRVKRNRFWLGAIAAALLFGNLADALWLVVPSFRAGGFDLRWTDLLALVGMGGLWLCAYRGQHRVQRLPGPALLTEPALGSLSG